MEENPPALKLGKYQIAEELGSGAFGTVYRAIDLDLGVERAVKILDPMLARDPTFRQLFIQEARAAARLRHSSIVSVYDVGEVSDRLYISMDYLRGQDLQRLVESRGPLSLELASKILWQVASALDYAHGQGLVHRDVKAANIMVSDEGHATLTDFGLVRALRGSAYFSDPGLSSARKVGSIAYMAPESIQKGEFTPRSDLYSFGVVLYQMVTGRLPFVGTEFEVQRGHLELVPPRPTVFRKDLPLALESVMLQALAKRPEQRYSNCTHLAQTVWWVVQPEQKRRATALPPPPPPLTWPGGRKGLCRSRHDRVFMGVCGGLAKQVGANPATVRILLVIASLVLSLFPVTVPLYLILGWLLPLEAETTAGR